MTDLNDLLLDMAEEIARLRTRISAIERREDPFQPGTPALGTGTVTSVALSLPALFTVSGSPVTTTGTLAAVLASQAANTVFAGPSTGAATTPTFRSLVAADIPNLDAAKITSGTLGVVRGGTGAATLASNGVLLGNGTSAVNVTTAGSANQVLRVPGGGGAPAFGAVDLSAAAAVTGALAKANQNAATAYTDAANTFSAAQAFQSHMDFSEVATPSAPGTNITRVYAPTDATQSQPLASMQTASADVWRIAASFADNWTPEFGGTTTNGTITYTTQYGRYIRFGNLWWIMFALTINAVSVAPTGNITIRGLPATARNVSNQFVGGYLTTIANLTYSAGYDNVQLHISPGAVTATLRQSASGQALLSMPASALVAASRVDGVFIYESA